MAKLGGSFIGRSQALICQACGGGNLNRLLDLGQQPLCNEFVPDTTSPSPQTYYPLCLCVCQSCELVQLDYVIPTGLTFGDQYTYLTGASPSLVTYYHALAKELVHKFGLMPGDAVIEIGSNDGTFLKEFQNLGMKVLGIEGARTSGKISRESGVPIIESFFGEGISKEISARLGGGVKIKLVLAMNVLAHTDNLPEFLDELREVMDVGSVMVSSSHWLVELIRKFEFDTIYHEHLRYYTMGSLIRVLEDHGLFIYDGEVTDFYGGSIMAYAKVIRQTPTDALADIINQELEMDVPQSLVNMKNVLVQNKSKLLSMLVDIKVSGKRAIGVGAPMKAATLLNFYGISSDLLPYIAEVNELKIGTLVPGVRIPVIEESLVFQDQPDYAVLLSWNMAQPIIRNYRKMGYRGKFIMPVPEPEVIDE